MSTRATVHFADADGTRAIVYRHSDGYPEGLGNDLQEFLADVSKALNDTRFNDPSYLAAKWVVWDAERHCEYFHGLKNGTSRLGFLGVGIVLKDPGDIEYRYTVLCTGRDTQPTVTCEEVTWKD